MEEKDIKVGNIIKCLMNVDLHLIISVDPNTKSYYTINVNNIESDRYYKNIHNYTLVINEQEIGNFLIALCKSKFPDGTEIKSVHGIVGIVQNNYYAETNFIVCKTTKGSATLYDNNLKQFARILELSTAPEEEIIPEPSIQQDSCSDDIKTHLAQFPTDVSNLSIKEILEICKLKYPIGTKVTSCADTIGIIENDHIFEISGENIICNNKKNRLLLFYNDEKVEWAQILELPKNKGGKIKYEPFPIEAVINIANCIPPSSKHGITNSALKHLLNTEPIKIYNPGIHGPKKVYDEEVIRTINLMINPKKKSKINPLDLLGIKSKSK